MNIKSLTLKNTLVDDKNGESYFDLTAPSFTYKSEFGIKAIHYVTSDQIGRIDIISEKYFGSTEYIDAICIVNNIFNPFIVNEGDILVIPNIKNENELYKRPNTNISPDSIQKQFTDTGLQSEKDQARIQRLIQASRKKKSGVSTPLPPNVLQPGESSESLNGGNITLGSNIGSRRS